MTTDPGPTDPQEADPYEHTAVRPDREVDPGAAAQALGLEAAIGRQVRQYRTAAGLSIAEMAARVGLSKAMLSKIENAQTSCRVTTLGRLANGLGIPVTALFHGLDADREAVYVPAGHGARIVRRSSRVGHGESACTLRPGDALRLDGEGPHGPRELVTLPVRFLSVTAFGDHHPQ